MIKLRDLRRAARMTQQEVADAVGIKRQQYQRYEAGKQSPRYDMMVRILETLQTKAATLNT